MMPIDRIRIEYTLAFVTPFHFGTGIREGLVDRTVVRDDGGYLYVPGSTIKGVLRERCEQLERLYEPEEPGQERIARGRQFVHSPHNAQAALSGLGSGKPTMVTRIFGSQNVPGRLFFDDARQDSDALKEYDSPQGEEKEEGVKRVEQGAEDESKGRYRSMQVSVSTQVRLDRPTRTAVPGALYTSEFGASDIVFQGSILGWLECSAIDPAIADLGQAQHPGAAPTYSLLLLLAGLRILERLGGNKSTGKGHCESTITSVGIKEHTYRDHEWLTWLEHLEALAYYEREG
jgi:CRISPR/Cas system CMR subunit Cmr4 (Cas7 group RAMP superfamily)